jgi:RNA polymerase sigma-70 factor (ECF subfamily)
MKSLWRGKEKRERDKNKEFEELALPYIDSLYNLALRMSKNTAMAEDLVQETYLRAYRSFRQFKPGTNCRAWLCKILYNLYINIYRKRRRDPQWEGLDKIDLQPYRSIVEESYLTPSNPEQELLRKSTAQELQMALEQLPEEYRIAVILSDIEGLTYNEIAEVTASPKGTVMSRLHRGRKQLQALLMKYIKNGD